MPDRHRPSTLLFVVWNKKKNSSVAMCLRISVFASFPYRLPLQILQAVTFNSLLLSFHKISPHAKSLPPISVLFFFNLIDTTFLHGETP